LRNGKRHSMSLQDVQVLFIWLLSPLKQASLSKSYLLISAGQSSPSPARIAITKAGPWFCSKATLLTSIRRRSILCHGLRRNDAVEVKVGSLLSILSSNFMSFTCVAWGRMFPLNGVVKAAHLPDALIFSMKLACGFWIMLCLVSSPVAEQFLDSGLIRYQ